ncbi:MAG: universal stress protein [Chloroflexota bacterium]
MFSKILLAVDGSDHAQRAAKVAGDLARVVNAEELRIIVTYPPIPASLGEPNLSKIIAERTQESDEILQKAVEVAGDFADGVVHTEALEGDTADAILRVADARQSDVIVMGSRGRSGLASLLLGSNSQKVVSNAPCPVLIVK